MIKLASAHPAPIGAADLEIHRARGTDANERGLALGAITTAIVQLHVDAFGKGPTFARTERSDHEHVRCFLREGLTRVESTLVAAQRGDLVRECRVAAYAHLEGGLRAIVEYGLERSVVRLAPHVAPELGLITLLFTLGVQHE